jgi:hypothetical protein
MGDRGPLPKRSQERSRDDRPSDDRIPMAKGIAQGGDAFPVKDHWHPTAVEWYEALGESGIAAFYERSDWATAMIVAEELTHYFNTSTSRRSAQMLTALFSMMTSLGATEGDRRRMRIELEKPKELTRSASLTAIDGYKSKLATPKK